MREVIVTKIANRENDPDIKIKSSLRICRMKVGFESTFVHKHSTHSTISSRSIVKFSTGINLSS